MKNSRKVKVISSSLLLVFVFQLLAPTAAYALTGGPTQPEMSGFQAIEDTNMVDLFSGDFNYNIPLLDIDGYPINMTYNSSVTMDQEASWVGLGWSLNPGAVNRSMRGVPDDFNGKEQAVKDYNIRPNKTVGITASAALGEIVGVPVFVNLGAHVGVFDNNYNGMGYELGIDAGLSSSSMMKGPLTADLGVGLSYNSQEGIEVTPHGGLAIKMSIRDSKSNNSYGMQAGIGASATISSRTGLKAYTLSPSVSLLTPSVKRSRLTGEYSPSVNSTSLFSRNATIPIGTQLSYTPQVDLPFISSSNAYDAGVGVELYWANAKFALKGYVTEQKLKQSSISSPMVGYAYAEKAEGKPTAIQDFNREKDGVFTTTTPGLAIANLTYDIYSVSGQGIGGVYRPHRSDVGIVSDPQVRSESVGDNIGVEAGLGNIMKLGGNVGSSSSYNESRKWAKTNYVLSALNFVPGSGTGSYEPCFFKQAGEFTVDDDPFYAALGNEHAVRIKIDSNGTAYNQLEGETNRVIGTMVKSSRSSKVQPLQMVTAGQAQKFGLTKQLTSYSWDYGNQGKYSLSSFSRLGGHRNSHHFSEVNVYRTDGARFVYGIPAYNTLQKEVTFNVNTQSKGGYTGYSAGNDNSVYNENGLDHYYSCNMIPAYSHSYLLTEVVSSDYVDRSGNGVSDDDLGTYTKFNYEQKYTKAYPYKWRTPYEKDVAQVSPGCLSDNEDDKANYIYGEKEIWYLHSIVTKNYVAEFYTSERYDAYGVVDENGGKNVGAPLFKLDSIKLYSKLDRLNNKGAAVAVKSVFFEYDYSLCPGVPSNSHAVGAGTMVNQGGKLTLKKIYFTYQNSERGQLNPYEFAYADPNHDFVIDAAYNPAYSKDAYNRWGYYGLQSNGLANYNFPYVEQDAGLANQYAGAWLLNTIKLPSGGIVKVDFESDDYAYVQNKRAAQMFLVKGVNNTPVFSSSNVLYNGTSINNTIFFDVPSGLSLPEFREKYIPGESEIYYKFLVNLTGKTGDDEYISGYAKVINSGLSGNKGWVELDPTRMGDGRDEKVNTISKNAWQMTRLSLSKKIFPGSRNQGSGVDALERILGFIKEVSVMIGGYNRTLRNWGYGRKFAIGQSWIRLNNPDYHKKGGGARVRQIKMNDSWADFGATAGQNFEYGTVYEYERYDADLKRNISSGVAEWEPLTGGEENPHKLPNAYSESFKAAPDNQFFQEYPYGESLYPNGSVGYAQVTVTDYNTKYGNYSKTGKTTNEFYTAKDFPILTDRTSVENIDQHPNFIMKLLDRNIENYRTVSQGYVIEFNNMHGVQKAISTYKHNQTEPATKEEYIYKLTGSDPNKNLDNQVLTVGKDGVVRKSTIGYSMDVTCDMREQESYFSSQTYLGNLDISLFPFPPIPIPIPTVIPFPCSEKTAFYSSVITKAIMRYGVLEKVVKTDLSSQITTENLLYDYETGKVVLTKTENEFKDAVYNFTYPAYWAYSGMGLVYKNLGIVLPNFTVSSTGAASSSQFLSEGDVIARSNGQLVWVDKMPNGKLKLIDEMGNVASGSYSKATIIKSGCKNVVEATVGELLMKTNPIVGNSLVFTNLIDAKAMEYGSDWPEFCECVVDINGSSNPFLNGKKGIWKLKRSYAYLVDRKYEFKNNSYHIREDGTFQGFTSFWTNNGGGDWKRNDANWTFAQEVTIVNPFGQELENRDALNNYSSATYGYNSTLPKAVANNSRYKELGFDSFEDYDNSICATKHFSFEGFLQNITSNQQHTGKYSIAVGPKQKVYMKKRLSCD